MNSDRIEPREGVATNRSQLAEQLFVVKEAARILNIKTWKLARAVRNGSVPSYTFFNSRRLVKLSEIQEIIERTRRGAPL